MPISAAKCRVLAPIDLRNESWGFIYSASHHFIWVLKFSQDLKLTFNFIWSELHKNYWRNFCEYLISSSEISKLVILNYCQTMHLLYSITVANCIFLLRRKSKASYLIYFSDLRIEVPNLLLCSEYFWIYIGLIRWLQQI